MRVLQICNKPPYPPVDGGTMAMNSITQGLLAAGASVRVLSVCSDKHPVRENEIPESYRKATHFEAVYIDLNPHPLDAGVAMFCGESYHVKRYISKSFAQKLTQVVKAEEFDIVLVEGIFLTPYLPVIRANSEAAIVLRAHNVENEIWRQLADGCHAPLRKWYLKHLSMTLAAYEAEHANDYDGIACITSHDADYFRKNGFRKKIAAIPFAVYPEPLDNIDEEPGSLFHIGSMDWLPNQQSIEWFLDNVWPLVHQKVPEAKMYIAGRHTPHEIMQRTDEGVTIVGEVPDAMYFIGSKQINVVPLLSGSGIRVKIIEAMSAGKTVISTTKGAQGIDYTDGKNILIADTAESFAEKIAQCVRNQEYCKEIGREAYTLITTRYNSENITRQLIEFFEQLNPNTND